MQRQQSLYANASWSLGRGARLVANSANCHGNASRSFVARPCVSLTTRLCLRTTGLTIRKCKVSQSKNAANRGGAAASRAAAMYHRQSGVMRGREPSKPPHYGWPNRSTESDAASVAYISVHLPAHLRGWRGRCFKAAMCGALSRFSARRPSGLPNVRQMWRW